MKDDNELEALLRGLRPGSLPADLRTAMRTPPVRPRRARRRHLAVMALPLAAAIAAAVMIALFLAGEGPVGDSAADAITIRQSRSTLVESRPLERVQIKGRLWELAEQEWIDEDLTFCSLSPVGVKLTATRHELVWQPVRFD